jgi:predicted HAD superfamily hydrolase
MELQLQQHPLTKEYPFLGSSFAEVRREAEKVSRKEREQLEGDTEVTFDEIYIVLQEFLGVPESVVKTLQHLEIETEIKVLYADPLMKEVFDYAKAQDKKVIICSDMYLPKILLKHLLESCGYDIQNTPIYVSCEYRKNKHTGELFEYLPKGNIIHIGDNEHSDMMMAQQRGLDSFYYGYQENLPLDFSHNTSITQSLIKGITTKIFLEKNGDLTPLEKIGLQVYGPFLSGFLIWFFSKIRNKKYDRILFFARDSFVFYEAIKKCSEKPELFFSSLPPIDYTYISRRAITFPTLFDLNISKLPRMMYGRGSRSIREWLKLYNIHNTSLITGDISAAGFSSDEAITYGEDPRLSNLLQRIYPHILEAVVQARIEAAKYFEQFSGNNIAIVDLGWSGSLQQGLSKLLSLTNPSVKVDGYYFHLWNLSNYSRASLHDNYYAYIRDHSEEFFADLPKLIREGGVELLEDVMSSSEGTTLGYLEGKPELEEVSPRALEELQSIAIKFFDEVLPLLQKISFSSLDSLEWTRPLFRMIEFPTLQEAEILGNILHSDVAGATNLSLNALAPKLDEVSLADKQLYHAAEERAYWKQAFKLRNKRVKHGKSNPRN